MQDSDSSKNIQLSFLSGSDLTFSPIISTALHEPIISNSSKTQSTASSQIINITSSNASPVLVPVLLTAMIKKLNAQKIFHSGYHLACR